MQNQGKGPGARAPRSEGRLRDFAEYAGKVNFSQHLARENHGFDVDRAAKVVCLNFDKAKLDEHMTVVCSGAARGGSSILPYLLHRLGLPMGTFEADNFEDIEILRNRHNRDSLKSIIEKRNAMYPRWGFKIPSLRRGQFGYFDEALRNPVFIYIFRNPVLTGLSVIDRAKAEAYTEDRRGFANALRGCMTSYNEFILFMAATRSPCVLLPMESLQSRALECVATITQRLQLTSNADVLRDIAEQVRSSGYKSRSIARGGNGD